MARIESRSKLLAELKTRDEAIECVLSWIEQTEAQDFREMPSKNHVYYYYMVAEFGEKYARGELRAALKENEDDLNL